MKKVLSLFVTVVMIFASVAVVPSAYAAAPKAITLSKTSQTVYIGQKYTLKVKAVTPKKADKDVKWKTSDKKIATVSSKGVVTGKKKGTVTITAVSKSNSKIKAKCKVTVKKFKTTGIKYGGKVLALNQAFVNGNPESIQDPHIIKTYSELKALKKRIKKTYDIWCYYSTSQTNPWYHDEDYAKGCGGDEILEKLDKYDKKFFKTKALYYNCIDFTTLIEGQDIDYTFECTKVRKKLTSKGKLTCFIYVRRKVKNFKKHDEKKNDVHYINDSSAYFIELNKKDIKGVQNYKLQHYEAIDLEVIDQLAYAQSN